MNRWPRFAVAAPSPSRRIPFRFFLRYFSYLLWNLAILYIGMRSRIDYIFLGRFDYAYPAAMLLSRLKRVPLITLFYGEEWSMISRRATPDRKLHSLFFPSFVRAVDLMVLTSEDARQDLQQAGLLKGGVVIAPGVDTELLRPPENKDQLRKKHAPDADLLLLSLARLSERKGQDRVIEAFAVLHEKYPGARASRGGGAQKGGARFLVGADGQQIRGSIRSPQTIFFRPDSLRSCGPAGCRVDAESPPPASDRNLIPRAISPTPKR